MSDVNDKMGFLFLAVSTSNGRIYATESSGTGGPWSSFQTLYTPATPRDRVASVSVAATQRTEHVCAVTSSAPARLLHTHREDGSGWSTTSSPLSTGIAPASVENISDADIAVLGIGSSTTGSWASALPLLRVLVPGAGRTVDRRGDQISGIDAGALNPSDPLVDVDFTPFGARGETFHHLCVATQSGGIYHALKEGSGKPAFGDIKREAGDPGTPVSLSCAEGIKGLHLCVVNDAGEIYHSLRRRDGTWTPFSSVNAEIGAVGTVFTGVAVSNYAAIGSEDLLHVTGVTDAGGLLYARRETAGSWTAAVDIKGTAGDPGAVTSVDLQAKPYIA